MFVSSICTAYQQLPHGALCGGDGICCWCVWHNACCASAAAPATFKHSRHLVQQRSCCSVHPAARDGGGCRALHAIEETCRCHMCTDTYTLS